MLRNVLIAAGLLSAAAGIQRWSSQRRQERRQERQADIPRWEGEGGNPAPASGPAAQGARAQSGTGSSATAGL